MADQDFNLTSFISLKKPTSGSYQNIWDIPVNDNWDVIANLFAGAAELGHQHTGVDGQGAQITHSNLLGAGSNDHASIDTHIGSSALHSDVTIGTVTGDVLTTPVTVNNVTRIDFANATVVDQGSGTILVTALGTDTVPELFSRTQSAPIAWTDNFNWPHGAAIGDNCWFSVKTTDLHPSYLVVGPAAVGPGVLTRVLLDGSTQTQGYALNHASCHIPHGTAQRVTMNVRRLEGLQGSPVATGDDVTMTLDILSATVGNSFARPALFGLSLVLNKPAGLATIDYALSLRPSATSSQDIIWTDFSGTLVDAAYSGTFDQLPQDFFAGCHEFSLRRDPLIPDAFWLQYYYNEGMVFRKYFSTLSTDPLTAQFATELQNLITTLGTSTVKQPAYGRMGWGLGYRLAASSKLIHEVTCITVGSQDDLDVVTGPLTPFPAGDVDPPPPPPEVSPVCPNNADFDGIEIGHEFDFDGADFGIPLGQWVIDGVISTEYGLLNGAGFEVRNTNDGTFWPVFCAPPVITNPGTVIEIESFIIAGSSTLPGIGLPTGGDEYAEVTLAYGDSTWPDDWAHPGGSTFKTPQSQVDPAVIAITDMTWGKVASDGSSQITLAHTTGSILPWGRTLDVTVTPGYDAQLGSDYKATWLGAMKVVPNKDITKISGLVASYWDDVTDPANALWRLVEPGTEVPEGSWIYTAVSAGGLPVGAEFWDEGNGYPGWTIEDTALGGVVQGVTYTPTSGLTPLWSVFVADTVPALSTPGGLATPAYILSDQPPPLTPFTGFPPATQFGTASLAFPGVAMLAAIFKLSASYATVQGTVPVLLDLRNPLNNQTMGFNGLSNIVIPTVTHRAPVVDDSSKTINTETFTPGEQGITLSFNVTYLDAADNTTEVCLISGFTQPCAVTIDTLNPTMIVTDNGDGTMTVTVADLILGASGPVVTEIVNGGVADGFPKATSIIWGTIEPTAPQKQPQVSGNSYTVYENASTLLMVKVKDIVDATVLSMSDSALFNIVNAATPTDVLAGVPDANGWLTWQIRIEGVETSGVFPATVDLIIDNGNGLTVSKTLVAVTSAVPCLESVSVDSLGGSSVWGIEPGISASRVLYFYTTGVADGGSFAPAILVGPGSLVPVSTLTKVSGDIVSAVWMQEYTASADVSELSQVSIAATTPSNGAPKSEILAYPNAITFQALIILTGTGLGDQGGAGGSSSGAKAAVTFDRTPEEGRYVEFTALGSFVPADSAGSDITADFIDTNGNSLTTAVTITAATDQSITGVAKMADDTAGRSMRLTVTNNTRAKSTAGSLNVLVVEPPRPRIRGATMTPPHAGTTGATITIAGTNLTPPDPPSGEAALTFGYTFFDSAVSAVLSSVTLVSSSSRQLVFSADVGAGTEGQTIGLAVDYLGGNTHRAGNLVTVIAEETANASVTNVLLYATNADPDAAPDEPPTFTNGVCWMRVTGTALGTANVASDGTGLSIEVVGELDDTVSSSIRETPPGPGTAEAQAVPRIFPGTFRRQSDTQLIIEVPCTPEYANSRVRLHLTKPASHPDGAVEWDQGALDGTGEGTARNLSNVGLTARYGAASRIPNMNTDPAAGVTHYDVAKSLQLQCVAGTEGDAITLTVRLEAAVLTADAPEVVAEADSVYGVTLEDVVVAKTANPLEIQITAVVPTPGINNTYPHAAFVDTTQALVALRFTNGQPIAAAILGASDWGSISTQVPF